MREFGASDNDMGLLGALKFRGNSRVLNKVAFIKTMFPNDRGGAENWCQWRELRGTIGRENDDFFAHMWKILHQCQGLVIGDKYNSKRRIDSTTLLGQMTAGEQSFKLHIIHLLNKIQSPIHRQLTVEALLAIAKLFSDNAELRIDDNLSTDSLIEQAVKLSWLKANPKSEKNYENEEAQAWQFFYHVPPYKMASYFLDALIYLLDNGKQNSPQNKAKI